MSKIIEQLHSDNPRTIGLTHVESDNGQHYVVSTVLLPSWFFNGEMFETMVFAYDGQCHGVSDFMDLGCVRSKDELDAIWDHNNVCCNVEKFLYTSEDDENESDDSGTAEATDA